MHSLHYLSYLSPKVLCQNKQRKKTERNPGSSGNQLLERRWWHSHCKVQLTLHHTQNVHKINSKHINSQERIRRSKKVHSCVTLCQHLRDKPRYDGHSHLHYSADCSWDLLVPVMMSGHWQCLVLTTPKYASDVRAAWCQVATVTRNSHMPRSQHNSLYQTTFVLTAIR